MVTLKWIKKNKLDQNEIEEYKSGGSKSYFMIKTQQEVESGGGHIIGWGFCERYERTFLIFDTQPKDMNSSCRWHLSPQDFETLGFDFTAFTGKHYKSPKNKKTSRNSVEKAHQ